MTTDSTRRTYLKALSALSVELVVGGCRRPGASGDVEDVPPENEGNVDRKAELDAAPRSDVGEAVAEDTTDTKAAKLVEPTEVAAANKQPHVLFISIDDLNDWVGVMGGHPQAKTPNIDALANGGLLFANAHCCAPSCNGSRTATMLGLRPSTTGVYGNDQPWRQPLPDAITIPAYFRKNGYHVIGAGKLFHGPFPDPAGWDEYHPSLCVQRPKDHIGKGKKKPLNGIQGLGHFDWGPTDQRDEDTSDADIIDWVIDHLPKADAKPTFLACGIFKPHLPWYLPKKWFDMFPRDSIELPQVRADDRDDLPRGAVKRLSHDADHQKILALDKWKDAVQAYLAAIAFCDHQVGRLVDALRKSPAADNTVVVLWSDHGWHLGEKLKWRKFSLWEEATHVPLIFAGPGVDEPGAVCKRAVSLLDVFPTLVDLCGLPPLRTLEGASLVKLLHRPQAEWKADAITTWGKGNHAIRTERWRYIRYKGGAQELYDHSTDPNEWTNLAEQKEHRALMAKLALRLPERSAPGARRKKSYDKSELDCDPDIYGEDEDTEEAEVDLDAAGGSPAPTADSPPGGAGGRSDAPG